MDKPVDPDLDQVGKFSLTLRGSCSRAVNDGGPSASIGAAQDLVGAAGAAAPLAR